MIPSQEISEIEIYLGEGRRQMRAALRSALRDLQLDITEDFENTEHLKTAVINGNADLVIVDADLSGGDACELIHAIRHEGLGPNPFVPIIVTTWKKDPERIRQLINSGVDGILVKPFSIGAIRVQIDTIIYRRKPFVVTSSYIGPDRRKDPKREGNAPLIEVPNSLQSKVNGTPVDPVVLKREISAVKENVLNERLRRNSFEIAFIVELLVDEDKASQASVNFERFVNRLLQVGEDTISRMAGTDFEHSTEICRSLGRVAESIVTGFPAHSPEDVAQLKPLADAILLSFNPERTAEGMAKEIAQNVAQFRGRNTQKPAQA